MSYAAAAAKGPKQSPEEVFIPKLYDRRFFPFSTYISSHLPEIEYCCGVQHHLGFSQVNTVS
jgi:hypothetical protein